MIRPVSPIDFECIPNIIEQAIKECVFVSGQDEAKLISECIKSFERWINTNGKGFCAVYIQDNVVTGYILLIDYWNLSQLFVRPYHQKLGIGRQLLEAAINEAKHNNTHGTIQLNSSLNAVGFYQKCGFSSNGEAKDLPGGCVPLQFLY